MKMKSSFLRMGAFAIGITLLTSACTSMAHTMREPNSRLELEKSDFTLSGQVSGEATTTRILGIDFSRLFGANMGASEGGVTSANPLAMLQMTAGSLPVIGSVAFDRTQSYALYELMAANPGYDVILYPQFETRVERPIGLGFIYKITTVKAMARLGKL